jgi:hypothetical protein
MFIPDPDPDFLPIPIPDPGVKKGTGSRIRSRNTVSNHITCCLAVLRFCGELIPPLG